MDELERNESGRAWTRREWTSLDYTRVDELGLHESGRVFCDKRCVSSLC